MPAFPDIRREERTPANPDGLTSIRPSGVEERRKPEPAALQRCEMIERLPSSALRCPYSEFHGTVRALAACLGVPTRNKVRALDIESPQPNTHAPRLLVAEDDPVTREYLITLLKSHGMQIAIAEDGHKAVARAREGQIDLVLLDIMMPGLDGLDCCRLIKSSVQEGFLPVVLLTARADTDSRVTGLRIGADDYVCKPFDERELLARINNLLRLKRMHDQITEAKERLAALAVRDDLTELFNYRYLQTRVTDEFKRAERYREPLSCVMIDVDYFKRINDRHGHDAGDDALREVAERLRKAVREVDVVARYGGEEFLLVLPSTNFSGALSVAERVWRSIGGENFVLGSASERITVSVGVAVYPSRDIKTRDQLLKAADRALYQAKHEGRDRICVFQHQGYIYRPDSLRPT
jgi:diguanylate cyclase (GGDEF)-like protein